MSKKSVGFYFSLPSLVLTAALLGATAPVSAQVVLEQGDATLGEQFYKRCASCHKLGENAKNSAGPVLNDIFGRVAGSFEGYRYGKDLVAAGEAGLIWDAQNLSEYIADPKAFLRTFLDDSGARSKMPLKVADEDDRWNVLAYLATFSTPPAE